MKQISSVSITHHFLQQFVKPGQCCIDATAGRGKDTVFLAQLVGDQGRVLAFDIQQEALDSTKQLLESLALNKGVQLVLDSHHHMQQYCQVPVDAIIFNFGYLPGGDHHICTDVTTSIAAIAQGLQMLKVGGVMSLCIYHGGDSGFAEKEGILAYLQTLDAQRYTVLLTQLYNRANCPPIPVGIIRIG